MRTNFKDNVQPFLGKRGDRDFFFNKSHTYQNNYHEKVYIMNSEEGVKKREPF